MNYLYSFFDNCFFFHKIYQVSLKKKKRKDIEKIKMNFVEFKQFVYQFQRNISYQQKHQTSEQQIEDFYIFCLYEFHPQYNAVFHIPIQWASQELIDQLRLKFQDDSLELLLVKETFKYPSPPFSDFTLWFIKSDTHHLQRIDYYIHLFDKMESYPILDTYPFQNEKQIDYLLDKLSRKYSLFFFKKHTCIGFQPKFKWWSWKTWRFFT